MKTKGGGRSGGRRFTSALDAIKSDDPRARFLGRTVLAELAGSELASAEEWSLADRLLDAEARFDPHGSDLRLVSPGLELDDVVFIEDDEDDDDHDGDGGGGSI